MSNSKKEFDGDTYDTARDGARLRSQLERVLDLIRGGGWWTLVDLAHEAGCSEAGASARLRDLRKPRFGGYDVERKYVENGLWAYRLRPGNVSVLPASGKAQTPSAEDVQAALAEIEHLIAFRRSWVASYTPSHGLSVIKGWLARDGATRVRRR